MDPTFRRTEWRHPRKVLTDGRLADVDCVKEGGPERASFPAAASTAAEPRTRAGEVSWSSDTAFGRFGSRYCERTMGPLFLS